MLRSVLLHLDSAAASLERAHAAKGIFHPSLVTLFEVLRDGDRLLLAYEFVPAQTVAQFTGGLPLNPKRAAEILIELGDAVAELHARGVTHGGISQSTVLITLKGKAKLDRVGDPSVTDFRRPEPARDLVALGELLHGLAATSSRTPATPQGLDRVIDRARSGALDSAAAFAALLRSLVS